MNRQVHDADIDTSPALAIRALSKRFGPVRALDDVSFEVRTGEVHALLGENGAGKSTLIKLIAGVEQPDAGELVLAGREVALAHPAAAIDEGIASVHQMPAFVPELSITENLRLGLPFGERRLGLIDWRAEHAAAADALAVVGLDPDPRMPVSELGTSDRQLVALARAMRSQPRILILDEIAAALNEPEIEGLHDVIRSLRDRGVAVIYVSHRLEEVLAIADRATVLRDGRYVATAELSGVTSRDLADLIVGREMEDLFDRSVASPEASSAPPMLEVSTRDELNESAWSFRLAAGEIVGLAGLAGSGRTHLLQKIFGAQAAPDLVMTLDGKPHRPQHPADAIAAGVALVTEDRHVDGYIPLLPIWQNVSLPWVSRFRRAGMIRRRSERQAALRSVQALDVQMPSVDASMDALSGGNQQKCILARWIDQPLRVLLLDEPTQAVDIRAKKEIYDIVRGLAAKGVAVVIASSEFEEIEALCDRAVLMRDGQVCGVLEGDGVNKHKLLSALLAWNEGEA